LDRRRHRLDRPAWDRSRSRSQTYPHNEYESESGRDHKHATGDHDRCSGSDHDLSNAVPGRSRQLYRVGGDFYPWRNLIEPKDVVIAILGSAAALAGFGLVFLGIVIASYESYAGAVPEAVVRPYRVAGAALLGTFGFGLVTVALSLIWLINGGPNGLYGWTIALFALQLIAVFASAAWTTRTVLYR
jgi:hypothetical protein